MRSHRFVFFVLLAIFFAVKIGFDIARIAELRRQGKEWERLEKSSAETAKKMQETAIEMKKLCNEAYNQCKEITNGSPDCKPCT